MSVPAQEYPDRIGFQPDGPAPFTPYIAPETNLRELTILPVIVGAILGLIFGASVTLPSRRRQALEARLDD